MLETPTIASTMYAQAMNASQTYPLNVMSQAAAGALATYSGGLQIGSTTVTKQEPQMAEFSTRLVKVFIVDPNINLPLESRLLHKGDEKITDLTDQELFFEVDINGLLAKHNEIRVKTEDKKANKDKPVYLEAARVRDLKMQVVVLAQF